MTRKLVLLAASVAALLVAAPPAMATGSTPSLTIDSDGGASSTAVLHWSEIAESVIGADHGPGPAQVLMATVEVAIYDAVVAVEGGADPYAALFPNVDEPASLNAAVATAAHGVLVARVPERAATVGRLYREYLATVPAGEEKVNGISVGIQVADTVVQKRADDGLGATVPFEQPPPGPGVFEPVSEDPPIGVNHGLVTPFVMSSPAEFRPDGPDPLNSPDYAADLTEVRDLGRLDSEHRTPEQTETALFWSDHGFLQWSRALRAIVANQGLDDEDAARLLAMAHVAAADAGIGCFEAKYHYMYWRPVHAIARADRDANAATEPDAGWAAQLTANHPEYPSGAACVNAAITSTVSTYFGTDEIPLVVTSAVTGTTRRYDRLSDALAEDLDARVWSGLHFRNSMDEGAELGVAVAELMSRTRFRPTS